MPKISFIISSYNGLDLIRKNLPAVIAEARDDDEILITDDAGQDLTIPYFHHKYNLTLIEENTNYELYQAQIIIDEQGELSTQPAAKKITLTLINNLKNLRFGANNNQAISLAQNNLVFLLNNDCAPQADCVVNLLKTHQENLDKNIFAITCLEISTNQNHEKHGKNRLWFSQGRFKHAKANNFKAGETAWACGGSTLYDRQKFLELGGFDRLYYPAYWEDIDLSFQAQKNDMQVLFEPTAIVHHNHETTNQTVFGQQKIDQMSWRNGSKFTLKNGTLLQKIMFILWSPYWFFKRNKFAALLIIILLLSSVIRFVQLGNIPRGMTPDETAIAYNGWSIWNTRRDEWLIRLPISFKSFGDYKAPFAVYFTGFFTFMFGLSPFVFRLPFFLFSILAIGGFAALTHQILTTYQSKNAKIITLLGTLTFSLTPWHFFFSRVGFESGIALTFIIWAAFFFLNYMYDQNKNIWHHWWRMILAMCLFTTSFYIYHSSKLTAPFLILTLLIATGGKLNRKFIPFFSAALISLIILIPFFHDAIYGEGLTRMGTSFIANETLSTSAKFSQIIINIFKQLSPSFLIGGETGADGLFHGTGGGWGVFLLPTFIMIICGFILGLWQCKQSRKLSTRFFVLIIFWIIFGLLPAAIVNDVPHANRAILAIPGFILLVVWAFEIILEFRPKKLNAHLFSSSIIYTYLFLQIIFGAAYLNYYFKEYPKYSDDYYKAQYLEAFKISKTYESQVDDILFTDEFTQPYIFALFANEIPAANFNYGVLEKYEFTDNIKKSDYDRVKYLIVIGPKHLSEFRDFTPDQALYDAQGKPKFIFYLSQGKANE